MQEVIAAGAGCYDVDGGEDALVGKRAVKLELHIACTLELLEDNLVHLAARIYQGRGNDGERTAAVNIVASSTRRDDLLQDQSTINRMWILRNYISDMTAIEAMTDVKKRLEDTLNNEEFLNSMNS